jgi:hypothetical protein
MERENWSHVLSVSTHPRVKWQETSFNDLLRTANATHRSTVGTVNVLVQGMFNCANVHVNCKPVFWIRITLMPIQIRIRIRLITLMRILILIFI